MSLYFSRPFPGCYDNGDDGGGGADDKGGDTDKTFTQDDVNRIVEERLARDRKTRETQAQKLKEQYEFLLQNQNVTEEERTRLKEGYDDLKKQMMTKEQQAKEEKRQLEERFQGRIKELETQAGQWENHFKDSTIRRALQDAAVELEAYNPSQVVTLLFGNTKLVDEVDDAGKPTGGFKTMVDFTETNESGETVVTQRTPKDAVKKMSELREFQNLFKSGVVSGVGANSANGGLTPGSGRIDVKKLTPEQYRKIRKEQPELLGLRSQS